MNFIDASICILLIYNIFLGCRKGLIQSILDILALILSVVVALNFINQASALWGGLFDMSDASARLWGFLIVWFVVFLLLMFLGMLINKISDITILAPLNVMGGGIFGLGNGYLILLPLLLLILFFDFPLLRESVFIKFNRPMLLKIRNSLPATVLDYEKMKSNFPDAREQKIQYLLKKYKIDMSKLPGKTR